MIRLHIWAKPSLFNWSVPKNNENFLLKGSRYQLLQLKKSHLKLNRNYLTKKLKHLCQLSMLLHLHQPRNIATFPGLKTDMVLLMLSN